VLVIGVLSMVLPFSAVIAVAVEMSVHEAVLLFAVSVLSGGTAVILGYWVNRSETVAVRQWLAGNGVDPLLAREGLLVGSQVAMIRSTVVGAFGLSAGSAVTCVALGRLGLTGAFGLVLSVFALVPGACMVVGFGIRLVHGTLAREVDDAVGGQGPPLQGGWLLRSRLQLVLLSASVATGGAATAATRFTDTGNSRILVGLVMSVGLGAYLTFVIGYGVLGPTLDPVKDLLAATQRVRRGEFSMPVPVTTPDEFGDLAASFNDMQRGLREREALHAAFGSYVDPALARRLIESGSSMFEGEDLVLTVLFVDVRDFTALSERVTSAEAVELLNRLFDVIVPILHEHGGHANHYLGDGLLAVFGAPEPVKHHANAAVAAAVEIQRRVGVEFGRDLRIGIGINTGPVIAGTVGGGGRHEFTVIGDTVNTASRVEQLTKDTGDAILMTEATRAALSPPRPRATKRGDFTVRGKAAKVAVHAVNPFARSAR
jgi:adenylate cyclase